MIFDAGKHRNKAQRTAGRKQWDFTITETPSFPRTAFEDRSGGKYQTFIW
jgi:hypothetical protein